MGEGAVLHSEETMSFFYTCVFP